MTLPLTSPPGHICILRLSALGDVSNVVPVVLAIQKAWPQTRITWITGKAEHSLLKGLNGVEFIVYDKKTGLKGMREIWKHLAGIRFDILLHMQAALRASLLSVGIKARVRLGFDKARAKDWQWLFTGQKIPARHNGHVAEGFYDFLQALGIAPESPEQMQWHLPVSDQARMEAGQKCPFERYAVISPCSSQRARNFRNWTIEGYVAVIEHLYHRYGIKAVITGGNRDIEREYAESICQRASTPVLSLVDNTSLQGLVALIDTAELVIAPDSGPVHFANAVNTPVIGLFATSNVDRTGPYRWREWAVNCYPQAAEKYMAKSVDQLSWGQRVRHPEAMTVIGIQAVLDQIDRLMRHKQSDSH
ncbi:glycosyltransferase family 9 protein [Oceanospirillum sediminis]|uniref:Glycosyltransferase family 9 protein n=1 Tax=Oceanospirillum sediminis TaxID=2760088 RepID=A0A839IV72_9GAMM|nr:glycosyltransferase family 9 protein [Oceanospirillum sediminis]MBB1489343.1 glycosyltransferase family 9 protein [Oceanospirillum sediminis]